MKAVNVTMETKCEVTTAYTLYLCWSCIILAFGLRFTWRCATFLGWGALSSTSSWFDSCCTRLLRGRFSCSTPSYRLLCGGFRSRLCHRRWLLWRNCGLSYNVVKDAVDSTRQQSIIPRSIFAPKPPFAAILS